MAPPVAPLGDRAARERYPPGGMAAFCHRTQHLIRSEAVPPGGPAHQARPSQPSRDGGKQASRSVGEGWGRGAVPLWTPLPVLPPTPGWVGESAGAQDHLGLEIPAQPLSALSVDDPDDSAAISPRGDASSAVQYALFALKPDEDARTEEPGSGE